MSQESYTGMSPVYDLFMEGTPYEEWADFLQETMDREGPAIPKGEDERADALRTERNTFVELACGTGVLSEMMYEKGFDVIGIDLSEEMLDVAMERRQEKELDILYLQQDMRELELYGTTGLVGCLCGSLNYLLEEEDVLQVFRLVENYLFPGGLFVFDFHTVYQYEELLGDTVLAENRENCSFIWDNSYDPETGIESYELTVFAKNSEGLYEKFTEEHIQRGYTAEQMKALAEKAGLTVLQVLDGETYEEADEESARVLIVCKECRKGDAK